MHYEHVAIQLPKTENNIGTLKVPQKALCKNLMCSSILEVVSQSTDVTEENLLTVDPFDAVFQRRM